MKNNNNAHKCENCGKTFQPFTNGASGIYGPECVKKFLGKEIEEVNAIEQAFNGSNFLGDKRFFNAKAVIEKYMEEFNSLYEEINNDENSDLLGDLLADVNEDLNQEAQKVSDLVKNLSNNKLKAFDLLRIVQEFEHETASNLAAATYIYKYADKHSDLILNCFNDAQKLLFAKNVYSSMSILNALANHKNPTIQREAKNSILIKKQIKKEGL